MARVASSFKTKFEVALDSRIGKALARMEGLSVCAGIRNDKDNAFKARVNHYGGTLSRRDTHLEEKGISASGKPMFRLKAKTNIIRIPERHFIDVPLEKDSWALSDFEKKVAKIMSGGRTRNIAAESTSIGQKGGVVKDLLEIAKKLADAQINAVYAAHPENTESTAKKKGFNAPLRETYEMVDSIEGWVE